MPQPWPLAYVHHLYDLGERTQYLLSQSVDQDRLCLPCFSCLPPYGSPPVSVACTYTMYL